MIGYNSPNRKGKNSKSEHNKTYGSRYGGYYGGYGNYGGGYTYGSLWNWGSVGGSQFSDDSELYVKEPSNYLTPTAKNIESEYHGVRNQEQIDQIKELARVCYFKMIGDKDYLVPKYADIDKLPEEQQEIVKKKKEFYDEIYNKFIPGYSPLEQAVNIFKSLDAVKNVKGQTGEANKDFNLKALNFNRRAYTDHDINDQLELNKVSKKRKFEIMNLVSIVGDFGNEFKVEKEVKEKIVANSDIVSKMMMRDYSQLHQVELYQRLFPHFNTKLLTKDLVVNTPVDRKEKKQKIIILLDYSGSMRESEKQDWVNAVLIDRFRYVMKGEAEVFFSYFVDDPDDLHFTHVKDRKDVIDFWSNFSNLPNGGETHIGRMVKYVSEEISRGRLHNLQMDLREEKPEILILNDGQDTVKTKEFEYKVNNIALFQKNDELKRLCTETKGKQIYVSKSNQVYAYTAEGKQKIN